MFSWILFVLVIVIVEIYKLKALEIVINWSFCQPEVCIDRSNILINQGFHKCAKNGQHHSRRQKMIHFDIEISHRYGSSIHLEEQTHQKCCSDSTNAKLCCIPGKVRTWVTDVSAGACPVSSDCCLHHPTSESDRTQARNLPETMLWKIIHSKCFSVSDWLKSHA